MFQNLHDGCETLLNLCQHSSFSRRNLVSWPRELQEACRNQRKSEMISPQANMIEYQLLSYHQSRANQAFSFLCRLWRRILFHVSLQSRSESEIGRASC